MICFAGDLYLMKECDELHHVYFERLFPSYILPSNKHFGILTRNILSLSRRGKGESAESTFPSLVLRPGHLGGRAIVGELNCD